MQRLGTAPSIGHTARDRDTRRAYRRGRSQARAGRWRAQGGTGGQCIRTRLRNFRRGTAKLRKTARPTHDQLVQDSEREGRKVTGEDRTPALEAAVEQVAAAEACEQQAVTELLQEMSSDGYGGVPDAKPDGVIRLFGENVNNFGIYDKTKEWKLKRLREINRRFQTDGALLLEGGVDFRQVPDDKKFETFLGGTAEKVAVATNNVTEPSARTQPGGTAAVAFSRLAGYTQKSGSDPTGLGRWTWLLVGSGSTRTRIVTAYHPAEPSSRSVRGASRSSRTVWEQHRRYFRRRHNFRSPGLLFREHLHQELEQWHNDGDEIILFMDLNADVYTSAFAKTLAESSLRMGEQFRAVHGYEAPASYFRGSKPITGCFATPGIDCLATYVSPHQKGAGDHRYWVMDFCARSVLGLEYPNLVRPRGRKLKCTVDRTMKRYLTRLRELTIEHRIFDKLEDLQRRYPSRTKGESATAFNKWDREVTELQLAAEARCNQFMDGSIEYSPEVNLWIRRRDCYSWTLKFLEGGEVNIGNLCRTAAALRISDPRSMTRELVLARRDACVKRLFELKRIAPQLRREHLRSCLMRAREKGDEGAVMRIRAILRNEASRKRWRGVARSTKPRRGAAITAVRVRDGGGEDSTLYQMRADVEKKVSDQLGKRFRLSRDAPICFGSLFDDVGYLGDTAATAKILRGEYTFGEDVDPHTKYILEEAHKLFIHRSTSEVASLVSGEDFSYYWQRADERTSSSASNIHFGHYKAAAHDQYLSALHAAKLSFAAKSGIPLERWGAAITVLLEKEFGNIFVDKLRAICLLEADFNWLNKLVFARRMMDQAYASNQVPNEQFARRGVQAAHGVLCKVLFCDIVRALHVMAGLESVDLGNCYDAVAHPIASIALQAFQTPLAMVVLTLSVLQTMTFYLRTGYGVATEGYGGTPDDPMFGFGQGNGQAPPGFTAVSALMSNAYRRLGHGSAFVGAWSGILFFLAAIIFVDDTDLLHVGQRRDMSDQEFFCQVQRATTDWGLITQATGGYLKPSKCFWYMMSWEWVRGVPRLKSLRKLPRTELVIPQKSGDPAPIPLKDVSVAQKTLGIWTCPAGDFGTHVKEVRKAGMTWTTRLRNRPLPRADAWLGFRHALYRKMNYGFSAIVVDPDLLDRTFQDVYRSALPSLGVNRNITKFFRTAPRRFGGLEMPQPSIDMLSQKLHLLQSEWSQPTATGNMLRQSLEVFQMELGLSSNPFTEDYEQYSQLVSAGWWQHLWLLCSRFGVTFEFGQEYQIPLLRDGDASFMSAVIALGVYSRSQLVVVNRVRKFKGIHSVADMVLCDGCTIDRWFLTREPSRSTRVFSEERPLFRDFALFAEAVHMLSSPQLTLPSRLGAFVGRPHQPDHWFVSEDRASLYHAVSNSRYVLWSRDDAAPVTRHGSRYLSPRHLCGQCPRTTRASVIIRPDAITLLSTAAVYVPRPSHRSFLERLRHAPNQSLWDTFECDGDGEWLYDGLLRGSLSMVSDGSYNSAIAGDVASGAFVIRCAQTGQSARGAWVERSDQYSADNYRAELLGALALHELIHVAMAGQYVPMAFTIRVGCDNKGVVHHENHPYRPMPDRQPQADLLRALKHRIKRAPYKARCYHVMAHLDDLLSWDQLTFDEQTNVHADKLAETALKDAVASGRFISRTFPSEDMVIHVCGSKVTGSARPAILRCWGAKEAREFYHCKRLICRDDFDSIYWDGVEKALTSVSEMFATWATKQMSGFCATNHQLRYIDRTTVDKCPNCGCSPETADHISRCGDSGRSRLFRSSVVRLREWMARQQTAPDIANLFVAYLLARGSSSLTSLSPVIQSVRSAAALQDRLGWRNLLEGRLCRAWVDIQADHYRRRGIRKHAPTWARGLILRLLQLTHRQWTYRNSTVHIRVRDNLTFAQQERIIQRCEELLWTDPDDLLRSDRALLEVDFSALASGPAVYRQLWTEEVEVSMEAASTIRRNARSSGPVPDSLPPVDTEGSIRYRRRRRRSLSLLDSL